MLAGGSCFCLPLAGTNIQTGEEVAIKLVGQGAVLQQQAVWDGRSSLPTPRLLVCCRSLSRPGTRSCCMSPSCTRFFREEVGVFLGSCVNGRAC